MPRQHMHAALRLCSSPSTTATPGTFCPARGNFTHWIDVEKHDITELGEAELARDIERRGNQLFDGIAAAPQRRAITIANSTSFIGRLDDLIQMNKAAMFRADSRSSTWATASPTNSPAVLCSCCWSARRSRGASDGLSNRWRS